MLMEEEKKKRKNKKKKNKQTKGTENNAVGAEESGSSNQNHPAAEICVSEAHTDDTSGIDDDPNRDDTDGPKVVTFEEKIKQLQKDKVAHMQKEAIFDEKLKQLSRQKDANLLKEASFEENIMQSQKEISSLRRKEANQEEKIRQLHMEKDVYLQKEAEFEMKNSQLQSEKNSWLQKEAALEKINNELVDEVKTLNSKRVSLEKKIKEMEKDTENRVQKEVGLEERISLLVGEVENLNLMRVSLEEKVTETEKERDNWVQKLVKEFEELRTDIVQENQLLKANIQVLQTQVYNLENSAGSSYSPTGRKMNIPENGDLNSEVVATQALVIGENAELVEKVKNLYVELERRGPLIEVSSFLGADIITTSSEAAHIANESAQVDHATEPKSEPSEAVLHSGERLQTRKETIDKAASDHEYVSKIDSRIDANSLDIESDEIVQIPLDENEAQSAYLEAANADQDEEVPLTNAPLIGAPFRLISFFARYVSGADLVSKNSATSNR